MYRQYCLLPAPKHIFKMIISKFVVPVSDWRSVTRPNETLLYPKLSLWYLDPDKKDPVMIMTSPLMGKR